MSYLPVSVDEFGGLDLVHDPIQVGLSGAVDMLNTLLDRQGRLRSRDGYASFASLASNPLMLVKPVYGRSSGAVLYAVANSGADLRVARITQAGAVTQGTHANEAGTNAWLTTAGSGSSALQVTFYTADGTTQAIHWQSNTAGTWGGLGSFSGGGGPLGVTPVDARLIQAKDDRVKFSAAGDPFTFGVNDYVDVSPGDGQIVIEIVAWRNLVFVFKQTKFFVFTGTSVKSDGTPQFDYRTVNSGQGVKSSGGAVATAEGVYFANDAGVWLTTGDTPQRVSGPLDDLFARLTLPNTSAAVTNIIANGTVLRLAAARRMLYVFTGAGTLAYDRAMRVWTAHDLTALMGCGWSTTSSSPVLDGQEDLFFAKSTDSNIYRMSSASTTDNGAAISWLYQTGYSDVGGYFRGAQIKAAERKRLRMVDIYGTGTLTHQVLALNSRPNDVADPGGSVTLGTSPTVARGNRRRSSRGTFFAHKLSGTGAASVSKLTHWIAGVGSDT